ncbi:MAG: alpha/beta hydrolase [Pseudomonadota bacterium]
MTEDRARPRVLSVSIGDADIEYLDWGGSGPDLVLLHATGFLPWLWQPVAARLTDRFRVIAPYFCDHRMADPFEDGLGWGMLSEDFAAFCENLSLSGVRLVGHSMGGAVAALAEAARPGLARAMVLIEPIFLPQALYGVLRKVEEHPLASRSIRRRNQWAGPEEARAYLRGKTLFAQWDDEVLDLYIRYGMVPGEAGGLTLACHPQREAALFLGSTDRDPWPILPQLSCPILLLEGENSGNRRFVDLGQAAALLRDARLETVPGAGHLIPMEQPAETAARIADFFPGDRAA